MNVSFRLSESLARQLDRVAREKGMSKSDLLRTCLEAYLSEHREGRTPWELGKHLFGRYGSGRRDLGESCEAVAGELIHARARRH
jgi:hypothetical protein